MAQTEGIVVRKGEQWGRENGVKDGGYCVCYVEEGTICHEESKEIKSKLLIKLSNQKL